MPRWCSNVAASLYLSSSLPSTKNQETTTVARTCCARVSLVTSLLIFKCFIMHIALALGSASCLICDLYLPHLGHCLLSCKGRQMTEGHSCYDGTDSLTPVFVCIMFRLVEMPVSAAIGVAGFSGVSRPNWLLCLPLPHPHPHPWHWSASPSGW